VILPVEKNMENAAFVQEVVNLTNQFRATNGLAPLSIDLDLEEAAQLHSENMAYQDFFDHTGKDGSKPSGRAQAAGYESGTVGENIAAGYTTPEAVVNGWINSAGHRANMLNANYNEIGVGYFYLSNDTGKVNYKAYWTQVFGKGEIESTSNPPVDQNSTVPAQIDPWQYGASHPDLIVAFGPNPAAFEAHYTLFGKAEGRSYDSFNEIGYLASNPDLLGAFGYNPTIATQHYVQYGYFEGRSTERFPVASYLATNPDVLTAYGYNPQAAQQHYAQHGYFEGRSVNQFPADQYLASYPDLIQAYGYDLAGATQHYAQHGFAEGRSPDTFDEAVYLASHADLIQAFGYDLAAATQHYIQHGVWENRAKTLFNPTDYLNQYADLQAAFGNDLSLATWHYITFGHGEGRVWA
jgi:hypothetical protein